MKTIIVLVMHGIPPKDFPPQELAEFFSLQGRLRRETGPQKISLTERHETLERKLRKWPRNAGNDPFYVASRELAAGLSNVTGNSVLVGYNEFCSPDFEEAIMEAANEAPDRILIVTPMMTRGGEHAEIEIPAKINKLQILYPRIKLVYAWPFETEQVARFLANHISDFE